MCDSDLKPPHLGVLTPRQNGYLTDVPGHVFATLAWLALEDIARQSVIEVLPQVESVG